MSKKTLGISSVALAIMALFLSIHTPYYPSPGDILLNSLGLKAWTNGDQGIHLTVCYAVIIIFIASIGIQKYFYPTYPNLYKKGFMIVLGGAVSLTLVTCFMLKTMKTLHPGLNALEFLEEKSMYRYDLGEDPYFEATIAIKNYSNEIQQFYISPFIESSTFTTFLDNPALGYLPSSTEPLLLEIYPQSTTYIKVNLLPNLTPADLEAIGDISCEDGPISKIVLHNDQESLLLQEGYIFGEAITSYPTN